MNYKKRYCARCKHSLVPRTRFIIHQGKRYCRHCARALRLR